MKVRDLMTTDIEAADFETSLEEVAIMMRDSDTGAIPVLDDDGGLVGIITDRDIVLRCVAQGADPSEVTVEDAMSADLHTVEPDTDVREAADLMARNQIRRLPVVHDGELVGMVSLGDIAVKQGDDTVSGDTLEDVSQGVKGRRPQGRSGGSERGAREGNGGRGAQRRESGGRTSMREQLRSRGRDAQREEADDRVLQKPAARSSTAPQVGRAVGKHTRGAAALPGTGGHGDSKSAGSSQAGGTRRMRGFEEHSSPVEQQSSREAEETSGRQASLRQSSVRPSTGRSSRSTHEGSGITVRRQAEEDKRQSKVAPNRRITRAADRTPSRKKAS